MIGSTKETKLNFRLLREIGKEGKNSEVFLAYDLQLDGNIAVKRIPIKRFKDVNNYFDEAKKLYDSNHPNVVQVKYSCQDEEHVYLAMPFYENGSLNQLINQRFLTTGEIIKYSLDFLSGLHHIHTKKLIHFDIKPNNVLLSNSMDGLLSDFGLAKYIDVYGTAEPDNMYNAQIPPESYLTNRFTVHTDIYQVGVTLYRLCNGNNEFYSQRNKFRNEDGTFDFDRFKRAVISGRYPDRGTFLPHIPNKLKTIIRKAMKPNPEERYNSVLEMMNELASIDKKLHWQYVQHAEAMEWTIEFETKCESLRLISINETCEVLGEKVMKSTARRTRISDWSKKNLDKQSALDFVTEILDIY